MADQQKKGRDPVDVTAARFSPDGTHLFLEIPGLQPVMQMKIKFSRPAKEGGKAEGEIFNTSNWVPAAK